MAESGEGKKNSTKYGGGNSQTQDDGTSGHVTDRSHMSDDFPDKKTNQMPKQNTSSNTTDGTRVNSQNPSRSFVSQAKDKFDKNKELQVSREERLHGKNTSSKVATKAALSSGQTRPEKFDNKKGEDRIKVTASNSAKGDGLTGFEHQSSAETSSDHSNLVMEDQGSFVLVSTGDVLLSKEISINVQLQCGKTVTLRVDPIDSIYSVKNKLGDPEGICLMFQDKELMEEKSWLYYDIKDGDSLYAYNKQESEIEVNVKMITGDGFNVSVGLTDTVEKVMLKIEKKTGFSCEKQRLIMAGKQLLKSETLLSHGIVKDSTIHLIVKTENAPDEAEGDSSSGLASNPTVVPETSDNPESKEKRDAMENNSAEETDPNCSSQQDSTENGNVGSQIEKSDSRIQNSPSPTPTSDVGSKYLQEQEGSGMLTHPTDINSQMKVNVKKSQDFQDSKSPKSRKKVDKLTTKVSDDGSDMNQGKGDTDKESEKNIPQTPETPDTEVVEEDAKDGMNVLKIDKGLQVFVVSLDKKKIAIDVKPEETVSAVKERLMDKIDCETDDFYLYLDGEKLNEKDTLESFNIHPNSEIIMRKQRRKAQSGQGKKEEKHPLRSTDEHGTGADQALESDEDIQPCYNNNLEESTGNPVNFDEGLVSDKACNEGSILKLKCSVNKQDMKAMWYKDGKPLEQSERITQISKDLTHILKIQNVCLSDAGNYTVNIENLESTSKVTVRGNPLTFKEELFNEENLNEGLNLNLRCSVNKLHVKPTWYKDGKPLERNKRITQTSEGLSHILEIQNVCLQDSGKYTVKIENIESTSKVTVLEKPLAVTLSLEKSTKAEIGKEVKMKCIVSKPNLVAKWTFNGKVIKNMETRIIVESSEMWHQLTIRNVTMDDAGEYCLDIEDLQEKTILEVWVIDDKENEDIEGAKGNISPIFNSSGTPDENETGDLVSLKSIHTSHANKSIGKTGHSLTQKGTHRSSKTVSIGNEVENFNDSSGICQKSRLAAVPSCEDMLTPQKGHVLHNAPGQTVGPCPSKMVKEKPMVNPCGKDLGDSSQRDGKSNPHSSTEDPVNELAASLDSLKISGTARSLPPTGGQQIAGEHGASGKEDSKIFQVIYRYSGDKQERRKLTNLNDYIKYYYVTKNKAHFKKVADDLQNEKQIAVSLNEGVLHIDQGQGRMDTLFKFILRSTDNIRVNGFPISAVDYEDVKKELLNPESNLSKEIEILVFENKIYVACETSLSADVDNYVTKTLKKFSYANKGNISEKSEVPYILRKILEKDDWKVQFKDKYPNVQVEWEPDDDEDVVKVVFSGNKEKVLEAMKWFEENIVGEYCCCNKEMVKIPELSLFSQPEEVVLEYLRLKYENQTDIVFDINRKKATVWFCSISSQGKADVARKELTNKGEIVKTFKIPVAEPLLHDTGIYELIPDWNKSKFAVVQVDEDKFVVKGLEKYVCEFEGKIKEMLKRKQNMPKSGKFLEYDSFLLYIEKNGVLRSLSERYKIQYSAFKNEERNGIYFTGEETCLTKFNEELEKKRKENISHNIDIHLGKGMESTKLDEILHTTEKDHDGHVKIEKMKNKDVSPGNYKTTILGPTLKDDLQDCLYTQWCLNTYNVTVVETRSDFQSADVVLVPVYDRSKSEFSQGSVKEITVPIPESKMYTKNPSIYIIETTISNTLSDEACVSVRLKSSAINGWSRYRYVKPILYSLVQWVKESKGPKKDIVLCCCDKDAFYCCSEYCQEAFKTKYETVKPINKDLYMDDFVVKVRKGGIVDFAVDVIVNTTSRDLKLDSGAVSSTILKSAGAELQTDVDKKRPDGIAYGEILETKAFKLKNAEVIFHGALEAYNKNAKSLQKLEEFVSSCFSHADSKQYTSIVLPAIGTGNLGYNKNEVAATMFKASKKFFRDHHPSALRRVLFVIYEKDWDCLKAFEKEEKLWNQQYLVSQSRAVVYEGVRVQPNQGSILDTTTDAVIYFWDDGKIHGSITTRRNTVLAACGKNVFDTVSKKMRSKEANLILQKAENIKVDIFFMRCQNSPEEISKATRECLLKADKCKNITSICIGFDKSHSFLLNKELTHYLCEAIKDVSHELHQIKQVEIMVEDENSFTKVLGYFRLEKTGLLKMKEPLRIVVSGFKEHVAKAVAEIKEKFLQLQTGNDITEAEPKNDKKDTDIKELLQKDDTVQLYSSSDSSESIVETIPYEDLDEQIREWENSSTSSLNMTSITHIPDDKEKNIKLDTVSEEIGVCPLQGTDCVSGRKVDNAAYIPETQIARGEEENQVFRIVKVGKSYVLKHNNLKVKIPQLDGASGVSVNEDIILIDNEPIYDIEINNGKVKISKIGDAECEVNRSDNNSTNNSGNKETGLYVKSQQPQNVEEESDMKKVRGTSQDMRDVLNLPKENRPNPLNHQDTVADVKHTGSFDADVLKQGGKTAFDAPRQQQQSLEEAVSKDEKPPIPAPRSKNKALFGVPMEKKAVDKPTALSEIHFIDINPETVKRNQNAFQGASVEITRGADSESFAATSLKTTEGFGATSLKTKEGFGATSLKTTKIQTPETEGEKKTPLTPATEGEKQTSQTLESEAEKKIQTPETEGEKKLSQILETEGGKKTPQTPETEGEKKTPLTSETEGEKKTPQTPETEGGKIPPQILETEGEKKTLLTLETGGEKDRKDDLKVLKMDKGTCLTKDQEDSFKFDGRLIQLTEIQIEALGKSLDEKLIGEGAFGKVYSSKDSELFEIPVAIKKIQTNISEKRPQREKHARMEMMANRLMNPFILPLIAFAKKPNVETWYITPYCENGDLNKAIEDGKARKDKKINRPEIRVRIALQIALAIQYIHTEVPNVRGSILHKDIASSNVVLDKNLNARLIDFGLAREKNDTSYTHSGRPGYIHPLEGHGDPVKESLDYYNFGIIILELLTSLGPLGEKQLHLKNMDENQIQDKLDTNVWYDKEITKTLYALSKMCSEEFKWTIKEFETNVIIALQDIMRTEVIDIYECQEETCQHCIINPIAKHSSLIDDHYENCTQKIKVCIACEKNSILNPVICYCGARLKSMIGSKWGALLVAGDDECPKKAAVMKREILELERVVTSKAPRIIGISKCNVKTVVPCDTKTEIKKEETPTWTKIQEHIADFAKNEEIDTLLIYISCHGYEEQVKESSKRNMFRLGKSSEYISLVAFEEQLETLNKIDKLIIFLDRCYPPMVEFKDRNREFVQINACSKDESAILKDEGSLFTTYVIQGLKARSEKRECSKDCEHCSSYWNKRHLLQ